MTNPDWDHYQIPLAPPPAPPAATAPPVRPATRPLARRGDRLAAAFLDLLIGVVPVAAAFLVPAALGFDAEGPGARVAVWGAGALLVATVQLSLLSWRGQSLGKMMVGVRIVDEEDDSNPGLVRVVVLRSFLPLFLSLVPLVGQVFVLFDLLAIFGDQRRCIHDRFAGTKVIET
ncbi:MAG TPA: RDD family protein [Gemmataceae bacterium]|nr:RDD family protein [Gemmataceae bacterium]